MKYKPFLLNNLTSEAKITIGSIDFTDKNILVDVFDASGESLIQTYSLPAKDIIGLNHQKQTTSLNIQVISKAMLIIVISSGEQSLDSLAVRLS